MSRYFIKFMSLMLVLVAVLVTMPIFSIEQLSSRNCRLHGEITGLETKRISFSGCYLKVGNVWMTYEEYKLRGITNE